MNIKYSIVIPTLNERENIVPLIQRIENCGLREFEILVVDENSPDGTCQAVNDYGKTKNNIRGMLNDGTPGLSPSIVKGFDLAGGEFLCCMDGDLQHDVKDLPAIFKTLEDNDFVIGSRYVAGGGFAEKWRLSRVIISRSAAMLTKLFLQVKVKDPMSGFFAVRKTAFNTVKSRLSPRGFKIMLEMLYLLGHSGKPCRVAECGITFNPRLHGQSKLTLKVILDFLRMLWQLPRRSRQAEKL